LQYFLLEKYTIFCYASFLFFLKRLNIFDELFNQHKTCCKDKKTVQRNEKSSRATRPFQTNQPRAPAPITQQPKARDKTDPKQQKPHYSLTAKTNIMLDRPDGV
jgi:hypothetical protein